MEFTPDQLENLGRAFEFGFSLVASIGVVSFAVGALLNLISRG
jgi:hypothetical protein